MADNENASLMLARADSLGAPTINGNVGVSLSDLDKLRGDYANALKAYREVSAHIQEIRIIVVSGDGTNNKVIKDKNIKEMSISYKNLNDVRELIASEEREKLKEQFDKINAELEKANKAHYDAVAAQTELKEQIEKKELLLVQQRAEHKKQIKTLERDIDGINDKFKEMSLANETLTKEKEELDISFKRLETQFNDVSQKLVQRVRAKRWWEI